MHNRPSVLIVEDDFLIRACLAEYLEDSGLIVHEADCRSEAILHLDNSDDVSILVTDISLPDGNGFDISRHARLTRPEMPVIFVSGFGRGSTHEQTPHTRFLSKPYAMSDVYDAITALTGAVAARQ